MARDGCGSGQRGGALIAFYSALRDRGKDVLIDCYAWGCVYQFLAQCFFQTGSLGLTGVRHWEWARTGRDRKKKKKKQKAVVAVEDLKPLTDGTNSGNKTGPAVTDQLIFRPHVFAGPDTPSIAFRHFPTVQPVTTTDLWCTLLPGKFGGKSLKYIAAIVVSFARWIHTVMETVRLSSARTREIYKK